MPDYAGPAGEFGESPDITLQGTQKTDAWFYYRESARVSHRMTPRQFTPYPVTNHMPTRRSFAATVVGGVLGTVSGCTSETTESETAPFGDVGQSPNETKPATGPTHRAELFEGYQRLEQSRTGFSEYLDGTAFPIPPAFGLVPSETVTQAIDEAADRFETAINAAPGSPSPQHRQAPRLATYHRRLYRFTQQLTQVQQQAAEIRRKLTLDGSRPPDSLPELLTSGLAQIERTPIKSQLTGLSQQHETLSFNYVEMPTPWERTAPAELIETSPFDLKYLSTRLEHDRSLTRGMQAYHTGRTQYASQEYVAAQRTFQEALTQFRAVDSQYTRMADIDPVGWILADLSAHRAALSAYRQSTEDMFRALVTVTGDTDSTLTPTKTAATVTHADSRLDQLPH